MLENLCLMDHVSFNFIFFFNHMILLSVILSCLCFFFFLLFLVFNMNRTMESKSSPTMKNNNDNNTDMKKKEELSVQLSRSPIPKVGTLRSNNLQFDRLQPSDEELVRENRFEFGQFVAREAVLDEEYWVCHKLWSNKKGKDKKKEGFYISFYLFVYLI